MDADVSQCNFENDALTCPACGYIADRRNTYRKCQKQTAADAISAVVPPPTIQDAIRSPAFRVGDAVETFLSTLGVSKERVSALSRSGKCKCDERREALNQWGYRQQERIESAAQAVKSFYFGVPHGDPERRAADVDSGTGSGQSGSSPGGRRP